MALISIKIKLSGDKKYQVEVDTELTIADLKTIISATADVAPENQRLIYSGKVLKDPETVAFYKIQNDHSIHLVKSAAKPAATSGAGNSVTSLGAGLGGAAAIPSNIAAGQGASNPLVDLTGARYAGYAQLPLALMFGPDGGMGAFPDSQELENAILNPAFQQQMNALLLDPRMLDAMIDQNPQLRSMGPEARRMLRPMFREMMTNPESLRQMMEVSRLALEGGMGCMGGFGGAPGTARAESAFPAPGSNPTVEGLAAATSSDFASGATAASPFAHMFGGGAPGFNPFLGGLGAQPAAQPDNRPPEEKYETQLRQLNEMGLTDFDQNVAVLRRSGGNVQGALELLFSGGF